MRIVWIFLGLAVLFLVPFLIWGGNFEQWLSADGAEQWLRGYGAWAWLAAIILLALDLFLPIPGTVVISALGLVYGTFIGGLVAATGSTLAGLLAYGVCRRMGLPMAKRLVGGPALEEGRRLFERAGGWIVVMSRWLPLLPEVVSCMAGIMRMPFRWFLLALICGTLPMAFVFAWIGATGRTNAGLALALSAIIPLILWLIVRGIFPSLMKRNES